MNTEKKITITVSSNKPSATAMSVFLQKLGEIQNQQQQKKQEKS